MHDEPMDSLSPMGVARREAMLSDLRAYMRALKRRRRVRRSVGTTAVLFVVAAALVTGVRGLQHERYPSVTPGMVATKDARKNGAYPATSSRDDVQILYVQTDSSVIDRLAAKPAHTVHLISDRELLVTLASLDRPAALVRDSGRAYLTRPVTDDELEASSQVR